MGSLLSPKPPRNRLSSGNRGPIPLFLKLVTVFGLVGAVIASLASLAFAISAPDFPDVPVTHRYYQAIRHLADWGIISGKADGKFYPDDPVTRQQFAKMIVRTCEYPVSEADICPFTDVEVSGTDDLFPDNYVAVCAAKGITRGKTPTSFDPYGNITRYQVISMVVRAAQDLGVALGPPPYGWQSQAGWEQDSTHGANAALAECNGLLAGLDLQALDPYQNMSRGEVAQVLYNLSQVLSGGGTTTSFSPVTVNPVTTTSTSSSTTSTTTSSTTTSSTEGPGAGYTLSVKRDPTTGGTVSINPELERYPAGTEVTLTAVPAQGWVFFAWAWEVGDSFVTTLSLEPSLTRTMNQNWSLIAQFRHSLTVNVSPQGSGIVATNPSIGPFKHGSQVTLTATPATGYVFDHWSGDATGSTNPLTVTMDVNKTITANFVQAQTHWENLGKIGPDVSIASAPAVASWGTKRLDVFVIGSDHALWHKWYDGSWHNWENLGAITTASRYLTKSPAAVSWGPNRIDVFAVDTGGILNHKWWNGSWHGWDIIDSDLPSDMGIDSSPAVASWDVGRLDVFVNGRNASGSENWLCHKWYDGTWHDWEKVRANKGFTQPSAVSWGPGRLDVFETGSATAGQPATVQQCWYETGSGWHGWTDLAGPSGGVTLYWTGVSSWASGRLDVFVMGSPSGGQFMLYRKVYSGGWSDWEAIPSTLGGTATIASAPAAVSWGNNRIDVFVKGSDGNIYHKWWDGSAWKP